MPSTTGRCDVTVVGSLNVDRVHRVPMLPKPGETVVATAVERLPGGKGLNQAVASARADARTHLVGAIGDDPDGQWLLDRLSAEGIEQRAITRDATRSTGCAVVAVDDIGTNSIIVDSGANASLRLDRAATATIQRAMVVLVSCEIAAPSIADALHHATGLRILNPAPAHDIDDDVLARCDIVTPNAHELADLAGTPAPPTPAGCSAGLTDDGSWVHR
jgi:ribokinase